MKNNKSTTMSRHEKCRRPAAGARVSVLSVMSSFTHFREPGSRLLTHSLAITRHRQKPVSVWLNSAGTGHPCQYSTDTEYQHSLVPELATDGPRQTIFRYSGRIYKVRNSPANMVFFINNNHYNLFLCIDSQGKVKYLFVIWYLDIYMFMVNWESICIRMRLDTWTI